MRIMFAIGPGDVVGSLKDWDGNIRTPTETSRTFSGLCFDFVRRHRHEAYFLSSFPSASAHQAQEIRAENLPKPRFEGLPSGTAFHLSQLLYGVRLSLLARRFNADYAVIDSGTTHWFVLVVMRLFGIQVIPNFHNVYSNPGEKAGLIGRLIQALDKLFFRCFVIRALGVSPACEREFPSRTYKLQWHVHYAQFAVNDFENFFQQTPHPISPQRPFRLMFAGRIEENKGVLDLVRIVEALTRRQLPVRLTICGGGPAAETLSAMIAQRGLHDVIQCLGKLPRIELLQAYRDSHAVVVPTKLSFCEGLPMVCAEAVLALRPVVSNRVSNAVELFGQAMLVAQVDDIESYVEQLASLMLDEKRYQAAVESARNVSERFITPSEGLDKKLELVIL